MYSTLMPWHHRDVIAALKGEFGAAPPMRVFDLTAHIGMDAVMFMYLFPDAMITAVEIIRDTAQILKQNGAVAVGIFGRRPEQFRAEVADALDVLHAERPRPGDIYYFDPPWGGMNTDYSQAPTLGKQPLPPLIGARLAGGSSVVVKLPRDVDLDAFDGKVGSPSSHYSIRDSRKTGTAAQRTSYWLLVYHSKVQTAAGSLQAVGE